MLTVESLSKSYGGDGSRRRMVRRRPAAKGDRVFAVGSRFHRLERFGKDRCRDVDGRDPVVAHDHVDQRPCRVRADIPDRRLHAVRQGLDDAGVITRDQAQGMVRDAQAKAEVDARAAATTQQDDTESSVRVTYVPQIVKDEITRQVSEGLETKVTDNPYTYTDYDAGSAQWKH